VCVSETFSGSILIVNNVLKFVKIISMCVCEKCSGVILIVSIGLNREMFCVIL
jgi:hypothetical protein